MYQGILSGRFVGSYLASFRNKASLHALGQSCRYSFSSKKEEHEQNRVIDKWKPERRKCDAIIGQDTGSHRL